MPAQTTLPESTVQQLADLFSALSDPTRVRLIACLTDGEKNVGELAEAVSMSESAVSHQLRGLRQMKLVKARKSGRYVYYSLDDDHVIDLFQRGLEHIQHG